MFTGQSSISPVFPGLEATSDHKTAIFAPAISSAKIITMPAASNTVPASSISGFPWYANLNMPFHFGLDHSTVPICEPDTAIAAKTDLLEPPKSQPEKRLYGNPTYNTWKIRLYGNPSCLCLQRPSHLQPLIIQLGHWSDPKSSYLYLQTIG